MANEKIQIEAGFDASGVHAGVSSAKRSLNDLIGQAQRTGEQGGRGLDKLGESAKQTAKDVERATRSSIASLQRDIALMEANGDRMSRTYRETIAKQRGADVGQLEPYLKKLDELKRKHHAALISAGQYANAMRMLPAQLTDITVGLATGQSPFMVLLQQGGQLKDMFGGVGAAARAVGGSLLRFVSNPAALATAAIGTLVYAMHQASEEAHAYNRAIIMSGNAAGTTVGQLESLASKIGQQTGDYSASRQTLLALVETGRVAAADMERIGAAITQTHVATGVAVKDLVRDYADIARDPVSAILKLNDKTGVLTTSIYMQARALRDQGKELEAVRLVQNAYAEETEKMAKQASESVGWIVAAWRAAKKGAGEAWDGLKDIGRAPTKQEVLGSLEEQAAHWRNRLNSGSDFDRTEARFRLADLNERIRLQRELVEQEKASADAQAKQIENNRKGKEAADRLADDFVKNQSKQVQLAERLAQIERDRAAALKNVTTEQEKQIINQQAAVNSDAARRDLGPNYDFETVLARQIRQESGGRHRRKDGRVITSSAGAVGIAQIMPSALSWWAGRAGMEANKQKLYDDPEYGLAIMRKAMKSLVDEFGGDWEKALSAYNHGYGGTVAKVKKYGANWKDYLPAETKGYIKNILGGVQLNAKGDGVAGPGFELSSFDSLFSKAKRDLADLDAQMKGLAKGAMTEFAKLDASGALGGMSKEQRESLRLVLEEKAVKQEALDMQRKFEEAENRRAEAAAQRAVASISENEETIRHLQMELQYLGGSRFAMEELARAREKDAAAELHRQALLAGNEAEKNLLMLVAEQYERIIALRRQINETPVRLDLGKSIKGGLDNYLDYYRDINKQIEEVTQNAFQGMEDALVSFVTKGKADFRSLAQSILSDIARLTLRQTVMKPLAQFLSSAISSMFGGGGGGGVDIFHGNALGGVYNSPSLSAYSGQIVDSPTLFKFAKGGTGLMGEAGPEAILPLKRGPGGYLGVRADAGKSGDVYVTVNAETGQTSAKGGGDKDAWAQIGRRVGEMTRAIIAEEKRPGGMLA